MDGVILFTVFSMGIAMPSMLGIAGIAVAVLMVGGIAYCKHLDKSIERGREEFREEFGYEMGESPWS